MIPTRTLRSPDTREHTEGKPEDEAEKKSDEVVDVESARLDEEAEDAESPDEQEETVEEEEEIDEEILAMRRAKWQPYLSYVDNLVSKGLIQAVSTRLTSVFYAPMLTLCTRGLCFWYLLATRDAYLVFYCHEY
ncbi:uncharacterized protein LOC128891521 [Hylaeus anthracinus]|uniref:uncharacterized protein LOC128891521 n=1 Tax=Hylaeus anthracinus TaxID=313031 RepID=UPI0023B95F5E|nr:uncharacterized protein LOC128891521 [Hylaeus anthracinus]